jgi:hypothetical protein
MEKTRWVRRVVEPPATEPRHGDERHHPGADATTVPPPSPPSLSRAPPRRRAPPRPSSQASPLPNSRRAIAGRPAHALLVAAPLTPADHARERSRRHFVTEGRRAGRRAGRMARRATAKYRIVRSIGWGRPGVPPSRRFSKSSPAPVWSLTCHIEARPFSVVTCSARVAELAFAGETSRWFAWRGAGRLDADVKGAPGGASREHRACNVTVHRLGGFHRAAAASR